MFHPVNPDPGRSVKGSELERAETGNKSSTRTCPRALILLASLCRVKDLQPSPKSRAEKGSRYTRKW